MKRLQEESSRQAEAQAAAAASMRLQAPRPASWQPPLDASAVVEYVTLDISSPGAAFTAAYSAIVKGTVICAVAYTVNDSLMSIRLYSQ